MLQYAASIHPGTKQLAAIHRHRLVALQNAVAEYSLFARSGQNNDGSVLARGKIEQQAADAKWLQWQTRLLSLWLGGEIPSPCDNTATRRQACRISARARSVTRARTP